MISKNSKFLKKTKIVATIGPASSTKDILYKMICSGVDVLRINFSHADYEEVAQRIRLVCEINAEYGFNTTILADLQGPKLRIGNVKKGTCINKGDILIFTNEKVQGDHTKVHMTYQNFANDLKVGEKILLDDGKLVLQCIETNNKDTVKARVIQGGSLKSKKGVNLPNTQISLPALTEKDIQDARFAIEQGVDWIALSFVRHKNDLIDLQEVIHKYTNDPIPIIAKIEKPEAIQNIDEIVTHCNGLMVARGDLGVEIPLEEVPTIQKKLVDKAKMARIPVIIATQMMESMLNSLSPTRAEVNDVANSVLDGADAVMLSAETSVGQYPVEVVTQMSKIIRKVEDDPRIRVPRYKPTIEANEGKRYITDKMSYTATKLAEQTKVKAIVTLTHSGYNTFQISSHRPPTYILAFTDNPKILCILNLLWGVIAFSYNKLVNTDDTIRDINEMAQKAGFLEKGDHVVNLSSMPVTEKGDTNTIRLSKI